jgi:hypothetical protein
VGVAVPDEDDDEVAAGAKDPILDKAIELLTKGGEKPVVTS